ncbi:hypothetical protein BKA70DRAFT_1216545 [Coprinopsis sp. MPI-PUGE-AT-0042]|nr:hypothetical protein BKA70DRAFT_1216545 [Coprinopsis sp. MPI-PUGE-AT-0042]
MSSKEYEWKTTCATVVFLESHLPTFLKAQKSKPKGTASFLKAMITAADSKWPTPEAEVKLTEELLATKEAELNAERKEIERTEALGCADDEQQGRPQDKKRARAAAKKQAELDTRAKKLAKMKKALVERVMPPSGWSNEAWRAHRAKKLSHWFYNKSGSKGGAGPKIQIVVGVPNTRVLTPIEVYSRMFYTSRVKATVDAFVNEKGIPKDRALPERVRITRMMFEKETPEVRESVRLATEAYAQDREKDQQIFENALVDDGIEERAPEEYHEFIERMGDILPPIFTPLAKKSGWVFTVLGGGPDPSNPEGGIRTMSYHYGAGDKASFHDIFSDWQNEVMKSYSAYIHGIFPKDVRESRALKRDQTALVETLRSLHQQGEDPIDTFSGSGPGISSPEEGTFGDHAGHTTTPPTQLPATVPQTYSSSSDSITNQNPAMEDVLEQGPQLHLPQAFQLDFPASAPELNVAGTYTYDPSGFIPGQDSLGNAMLGGGWLDYGDAAHIGSQLRDNASLTGAYLSTAREGTMTPYELPTEMQRSGPVVNPLIASFTSIPAPQAIPEPTTLTPHPFALPSIPESTRRDRPLPAIHVPSNGSSPTPAQTGQGETDLGDVRTIKKQSRAPCTKKRPAEESAQEPTGKRSRRLVTTKQQPPDWVIAALEYLRADVDNAVWSECLAAWAQFETAAAVFSENMGRLSNAKGRPAELTAWCSKRKGVVLPKEPELEDVHDFAARWLAWWNGMQPDWRKGEGEAPMTKAIRGNENLSGLKKPGTNGLFTALVALKWWRGGDSRRWRMAVDDMKNCFVALSE